MSNLKKQVTRWVEVLTNEDRYDNGVEQYTDIIADAALLYLVKDGIISTSEIGRSIDDTEIANLLELSYLV